jgi:hypothetical protein
LTASVRAGAVPSPRWVEKVVAIQATCAMPEISETAAETDKAETASSVLRDTVKRVVACLDAEALKKSHTAGGSDDGKDDDGKGVLRFAVAFANRFRGMGGEPKNKTRDSSNSFKRYAREFVVPRRGGGGGERARDDEDIPHRPGRLFFRGGALRAE